MTYVEFPLNKIIRYQIWGEQYGFETKSGFYFYHRDDGPAEVNISIRRQEVHLSWMLYNFSYTSTKDFFIDAGYNDEMVAFWLLKYGEQLPRYATLDNDTYLGTFSIEKFREHHNAQK